MHYNKAIKLVCWMVAILLIVVAILPTSYALFYNDVTRTLGNENFEAIMYASDNAIMVGTGSLTFSPNSYLNRAQTEYHTPTESNVTLLQQEIAAHGPVIFSYFWHKADGSTAGHTVIVTKIRKTGSNKYMLTFVDPNNSVGLVTKVMTATPYDIKMNGYTFTTIGYYTSNDINNLSFLDMDSDYNNIALNGLTR